MAEIMIWLGIVAGLVLIAVLGWFIWSKFREIKVHRTNYSRYEAQQAGQKQYLIDSLGILAKTILDDQIELSEGSIRIKVLIDNLDATLHALPAFKIFEEIYRKTEHMPTHQARKDTDKRFIHKYDQQRYALEQQNRERIREAARELLRHLESMQ